MLSTTNSLSLSFGPKLILDQIRFSLLPGERVALVGPNGAGKSTFLKVLAGYLEPDSGSVECTKGARIGFLTQEPQLDLENSVITALRLHFSGEDYQIEEVLSRLHIKARKEPIKNLSGGERRRVDLARVLLENPDIFLLDEPTNHLDIEAISFLIQYLKAQNKPVLFVSHDSYFIDQTSNKIIELDSGKLYSHEASYEQFLENKLIRTDIENRTLHKKDRLLAKELAWLRAGTPARTTKQDARISRAQALMAEVSEEFKRTRDKQVEIEKTRNKRLAKTILELKNLSFEPLFKNLNLLVTAQKRYGILGANGVGKTTLLSLISGSQNPTFGEVIRGPHTQIVQFDQNRAQLDPNKSLKETLADQGDVVFVGDKPIHIASYLERYLFLPSEQNRKVATLSGGEQNRLLLAKLLKQGANCLLLDEPTNDLDTATLGILEEMLLEHDGVAFIVSHDRRFLDRVCTDMLVFEGAKVVHYAGNYSTYERLKTEPAPLASEPQLKSSQKTEKKRFKRTFNEEREYASIEQAILEAESAYAEVGKTANYYLELEEKIKSLYNRWAYLEALD